MKHLEDVGKIHMIAKVVNTVLSIVKNLLELFLK